MEANQMEGAVKKIIIDELDRRIELQKLQIKVLTNIRNSETHLTEQAIAEMHISDIHEGLAQLQDFKVWVILCDVNPQPVVE